MHAALSAHFRRPSHQALPSHSTCRCHLPSVIAERKPLQLACRPFWATPGKDREGATRGEGARQEAYSGKGKWSEDGERLSLGGLREAEDCGATSKERAWSLSYVFLRRQLLGP
eukprot:3496040-Pleurochrysis_carterae.AAC.1